MERRKGFKAFTWALGSQHGRHMIFRVGGTYHAKGKIELCSNGFHWCDKLSDCYNWFPEVVSTRICEIEAWGNTEGYHSDGKFASRYIHIVRELSLPDILSKLEKDNISTRNRLLRSWESFFSMGFYSNVTLHRRVRHLMLACRADPFRIFRLKLRCCDTGSEGYLLLPGHAIFIEWDGLSFRKIWGDETQYELVSWKGTSKWVTSKDDLDELERKLPFGRHLIGGFTESEMISALSLMNTGRKK